MKALVILSGGQDSATCAAWARSNFDQVECLTFDYGQRHRRELESAAAIAKLIGAPHHVAKMDILRESGSALTGAGDVRQVDEASGLPKSFVPGRNLVFLTAAASFALGRGIVDMVTGVCQTDFSGYPDCRRATIDALETAIALGNEGLVKGPGGFRILTPLMFMTKAETVMLARRLPFGMEAVGLSWTCYEGGAEPCGTCPACVLRDKGFSEAGLADPARERPTAP